MGRWVSAAVCCGWLGGAGPGGAWAGGLGTDAEQKNARSLYRDCVLDKVQPARSAVAATHLLQACQRRFVPEQGLSLDKAGAARPAGQGVRQPERENEGPFDECLLQQLPTVHNDQSAHAMVQLCREQFGSPGRSAPTDQRPGRIWQWLGIKPDQQKREQSDWTMEGDAFVPLVPWQAGQPHTRENSR
ncbi:MAG: hypothetical protein H7838_07255 [Magnetococcus sp. DMHC-8]